MRWYLNDHSVRRQFQTHAEFEIALSKLGSACARTPALRDRFYITGTFVNRFVQPGLTVREALQRFTDRDQRGLLLLWMTRNGPFLEDDRLADPDDYFECFGEAVTDSGLGEAARRVKAEDDATTFSFSGGPSPTYETSPLSVDHGLPEDRLGRYAVPNVWTMDTLLNSAFDDGPAIISWPALIEGARERFPMLQIPDSVYQNRRLASQPFEVVVRDQALNLLSYLNAYMLARNADGSEGPEAHAIYRDYFQGDRARFSPESDSNRRTFKDALTFSDPDEPGRRIEAHWHGKISRNFFRLHFEWPIAREARRLKILYLGPKITKS